MDALFTDPHSGKPAASLAQERPRQSPLILILCFVLIFLAGASAIGMSLYVADTEEWVAHTIEVRRVNLLLFRTMRDAGSAERGYLLNKKGIYDSSFTDAIAALAALESQLVNLVADNPEQQDRVRRMNELIEQRSGQLRHTFELLRSGRRDEAIADFEGLLEENLTDKVRALSDTVDQTESDLLQKRQAAARHERAVLLVAIVTSLAISAALGWLVFRSFRRHVSALDERNRALAAEMHHRGIAEAQLRQSQKMEALGQLTGGVAHDFNNMLAVIIGNLDLMLRQWSGANPPSRHFVENALTGAKRAATLTQRLLAFSRLQPLEPKPAEVNKIVSSVSEMLRRTMGEHIAIETVLGGGTWRAFIDGPQLESALLNLAVNARDAMRGGGKLTIETANTHLDEAYCAANSEISPGDHVMIAVTDSGEGMSPEVQAKAFEPFFTTKPVGDGTGLGLSQVHGFIKQSGGHIKIYSEPGFGTTIKLYLPRHFGEKDEAEPIRPGVQHGDHQTTTILVVEDESEVRRFATEALQELGYQVLSAENAARALHLLETHTEINLLLTDIVMPEMNGRTLAEEACRRRPELKVLYMTGYTRNAIVHNGTLDPGTHLITKPFTVDRLELEIRSTLTR